MTLGPDDEAILLNAIRHVPEGIQDDAWKYAADRLRPLREPTVFDIRDIAHGILHRYAYAKDEPGKSRAGKWRRLQEQRKA